MQGATSHVGDPDRAPRRGSGGIEKSCAGQHASCATFGRLSCGKRTASASNSAMMRSGDPANVAPPACKEQHLMLGIRIAPPGEAAEE
ncbi:hypothetical protein F511_41517 [Dorcoceras hygrometricum]|uniref:Uncharacterized protein n=1 Tax=Dorcoceras hygrometricum TaxID=472368 RepID=A0A2Z7BGM3_9LAMI|nr:hypothetical protein F511_41517 [Dorcoceras hygrometricum]